jgi:hypothetical protein
MFESIICSGSVVPSSVKTYPLLLVEVALKILE